MPKKKTSPPVALKKTSVRKLKKPQYAHFRLAKRIKPVLQPVPSSFTLFAQTYRLLRTNWRVLALLSLLYLVLSLIFVRGLNVSVGADEIKPALVQLFEGGELLASVTLFGILLSSSGSVAGEAASVYQGVLLTTFSLATIWILRQWWSNKKKVTVRDGFYQGMYPLIPFIITLFIIGLQLIPLYLASFIAGTVYGAGIAVTPLEQVLWGILLVLLVLLACYWLCSSVFALFIATIPKTKPIQALKTASELVRHRRLIIARRLLFLPFALLILTAVIIFPLILLSPVVAEWVFLLLSAFALPVSLAYLYNLYRKLLP